MKLTFLGPLYARPGPYACAYVDTSRDLDDPDRAIALRRRQLEAELAAQGADVATTDAIAHVVGTDRDLPGRHGQAVFAAHTSPSPQNCPTRHPATPPATRCCPTPCRSPSNTPPTSPTPPSPSISSPWESAADAALIRSIAGTGADLIVVPRDELPLADGLGVLLRYFDGAGTYA